MLDELIILEGREMNISVIIPVYNAKKYIKKIVDNVIEQTFQVKEIILVDDGSTDGSGELCDYLADQNDNIIVLHKENGGQTSARREGVKIASNNCISFLDCDDWIEDDYFEKLSEAYEKYSCDMVVCGCIMEFDDKKVIVTNKVGAGIYDKEAIHKKIICRYLYDWKHRSQGMIQTLWGGLFYKSLIEEALCSVDDSIRIGEDGASLFFSLLKSEQLCILDYFGYHYVQHDLSMMRSFSIDRLCEIKKLKNIYENIAITQNLDIDGNRGISFRINNFVEQCISNYFDCYIVTKLEIPYEIIEGHRNIAVYGAGKHGVDIVNRLYKEKEFEIVVWADQKYMDIENTINDVPVVSPETLLHTHFDYVLIAIENYLIIRSVHSWLLENGIPFEKIITLNPVNVYESRR